MQIHGTFRIPKVPYDHSYRCFISRSLRNCGVRRTDEYARVSVADTLPQLDDNEKEFLKTVRNVQKRDVMSEEDVLSFIDAGIHNNVPVQVVNRPSRKPDVIIVADFSGRKKDDFEDYSELRLAMGNCWNEGLYYPGFVCEPVDSCTPTELIVFEPKQPESPTVIWFGLCNTEFKNADNYVPYSTEEPDDDKPFNMFPLFDDGGKYGTFNLKYSPYTFDRLRELYRFNVNSHIEEVKDAIKRVIQKKRLSAKL